MSDRPEGLRGIAVFATIAITGVTAVAGWLHLRGLSVGDPRAGVLIMAAMWMPAVARLVATRTVDRAWDAPFPLRHWGHPPLAVMLVPLALVSAIYLGSYASAALAGVPRQQPSWHGLAIVVNVAVNLPLLALIDLVGGLGEELGWRGYLQPRLDQLHVPGSVLWVIALECLFHLPLIALAGYLGSKAWVSSAALFLGLKLGATPVWTWATYRWRTIWIAAWFHAFHNAISQVLVPKSLGAGPAHILGESGVLPVALYLIAAAALFLARRSRGEKWRDVAAKAFA
jgi:membrane protease YdiL (CAAX protease family)